MSTTGTDRAREVDLFDPPPATRSFSPGDVLRAIIGLATILFGAVVAVGAQATVRGLERDLVATFSRLPDPVEVLVQLVLQLVVGLLPLVAFVVLLVRRRWRVAGMMVLASTLASVGLFLAEALVIDRDLTAFLEEIAAESDSTTSGFPDSSVIASVTAMVVVVAPWLSQRWRRALWAGVGTLVAMRLLVVGNPPFDLVLAVGVGTLVGSLLLLVFGSPSTEPRPVELLAGLRAAGFDPARIERSDGAAGALQYRLTEQGRKAWVVTLRTPGSTDAELLSRTWRRLRYRSSEVGAPYSSHKRRLEHEALGLVLAERAGARVPPVARLGETEGGSVFLVTPELPIRPVNGEDLRAAGVLDDLWAQVRALHKAGLAHRRLSREAVHVDQGGAVWLLDFDRAQTASAARERARDVAQLLVETGLVVGPEAAVHAAVDALGVPAVADAVRMLQPLAVPGDTRARARGADGDLFEQLRRAVTAQTGQPDIMLEPLERIKPRTALVIGFSAVAFYTLLPQLADFGDTIDAFGSAEPLWLGAALLASVATYVCAAVSFQGSVPDTLPFPANVRAQVAAGFAGLVGPAGAGGFALTGRFLQRNGVDTAAAAASVTVNAAGGFVVHLGLMALFFWWAGRASIGGFSLPDSQTVLLVLSVVLAAVGLSVAVGPLRRRVLVPLRDRAARGLADVGRAFRSPVRVVELIGGSTGISLAYVAAVFFCVEAFGGSLTFAQVGAAYLGAMAIATFAPTPGGLGAVESAMIAGLTGFGLGSGIAVSATLTFRLVTFWLPMLPGWAVLNVMQRREEL